MSDVLRVAQVRAVLGGGGRLELVARLESPLTPEIVASLVAVRETGPGAGTWEPPVPLGTPDPGLVGWATETAVGVNRDGRLDVAVREQGGRLGFTSQLPPDRHWSGDWKSLKRPEETEIFSSPACAPDALGRLTMFAVGEDGALWHRRQPTPGTGPWGPWASLGAPGEAGPRQEAPTVARNADGRLEVFVAARGVWHVWQTSPGGPWSAWAKLGSPAGARAWPRVVALADGRLQVCVLAPADPATADDAVLWTRSQETPGGPGWTPGWGGSQLGIPHPVPDRAAVAPGTQAGGRPVVLTGFPAGGAVELWLTERAADGDSARRLTGLPPGSRGFFRPELARDADGRLLLFWVTAGDAVVRGMRQEEPDGADWSPFTIGLAAHPG